MKLRNSFLSRMGVALLAALLLAGCRGADGAAAMERVQTAFEEFATQATGAYAYADDAYGEGTVYFFVEDGAATLLYQVPREGGLQETLVHQGKFYGKAAFAGMTEWAAAGDTGPDPAMPGFGALRNLLRAELWQFVPTEAEPLRFILSAQGKKQLRQQEIDGAQTMADIAENDIFQANAALMTDYAKASSYTNGTLTAVLSEDGRLNEIHWKLEVQRPQFVVNEQGEQGVSKEMSATTAAYLLKPLPLPAADIQAKLAEAVAALP